MKFPRERGEGGAGVSEYTWMRPCINESDSITITIAITITITITILLLIIVRRTLLKLWVGSE